VVYAPTKQALLGDLTILIINDANDQNKTLSTFVLLPKELESFLSELVPEFSIDEIRKEEKNPRSTYKKSIMQRQLLEIEDPTLLPAKMINRQQIANVSPFKTVSKNLSKLLEKLTILKSNESNLFGEFITMDCEKPLRPCKDELIEVKRISLIKETIENEIKNNIDYFVIYNNIPNEIAKLLKSQSLAFSWMDSFGEGNLRRILYKITSPDLLQKLRKLKCGHLNNFHHMNEEMIRASSVNSKIPIQLRCNKCQYTVSELEMRYLFPDYYLKASQNYNVKKIKNAFFL
jgi:hypothetical protein